MDGKIVIGTEVSTKGIDKGIALVEKRLEEIDKKRDAIFKKAENRSLTAKEQREVDALTQEYERLYRKSADLSTQKRQQNEIEKQNTSEILKQTENLNRLVNGVMKTSDGKTYVLKTEEEITQEERKQIEETRNHIANLDKIGNSVKKVIKNVVRWGLAIFSVRSGYMAIRRAMSTVSQYNEELASKIQYISYAFGMLLEPVIIRIVDWVYKLMSYIDYIAKRWFNLDKSIFKSANSMKKANKYANDLRKTLAGFDEMNILNDNVGGAGEISAPELTTLSDDDVWGPIKWIADNKDTVLGILSAITGGLIALKLSGLNPILGILGAILGLGLYEFIKNLIQMIKDPSWENFGKVLESLGVIIATISAILMVIGVASGPVGWIIMAIGILTSGVGKLIENLFKNKSAIKDVEKANKDLKEAKDKLYNATQNYTQAVKDEEQAHKDLIRVQDETGLSGEELYNLVDSGKTSYKNFNEQQRQVYDAYIKEQKAMGTLKDAEEKMIEARKIETKEAIESELANAKETESYDKLKESIVSAFKEGKISAGEARDYLSRAMGDMSTDSKKTFMEDLPNNVKAGLDPHKYDSFATKFKNWWNKWIKGLDTTIEITGVAKGGGGSGSSGGGGGGSRNAKGGIYYPSKLPKLAVGGIINQPGRGIPYHGAYIGERGAEAVVPLTDSQQMALLGETIGKYININATVPVYVGNRLVARELKRINAEDDFAYNR